MAYNSLGLMTTVTDAMGNARENVYSAGGQMTAQLAPGGARIDYVYTLDGRIARVTGFSGFTKEYEWCCCGMESYTDEQGTTLLEHNALSQLTSTAYASGLTVTLLPNHLNWNTKTTLPKTSGTEDTSYAYDLRGRVLSITVPDTSATTITIARDSMGRPTTIVYSGSHTVVYAWDAMGRATTITSTGKDAANTYVLTYAYVANADRVSTSPSGDVVSMVSGANRITYRYDEEMRLVEAQMATGDPVAVTYDGMGSLVSIVQGATTQKTLSFQGRILQTRDSSDVLQDKLFWVGGNLMRVNLNAAARNQSWDARGSNVLSYQTDGTMDKTRLWDNWGMEVFAAGAGSAPDVGFLSNFDLGSSGLSLTPQNNGWWAELGRSVEGGWKPRFQVGSGTGGSGDGGGGLCKPFDPPWDDDTFSDDDDKGMACWVKVPCTSPAGYDVTCSERVPCSECAADAGEEQKDCRCECCSEEGCKNVEGLHCAVPVCLLNVKDDILGEGTRATRNLWQCADGEPCYGPDFGKGGKPCPCCGDGRCCTPEELCPGGAVANDGGECLEFCAVVAGCCVECVTKCEISCSDSGPTNLCQPLVVAALACCLTCVD